MLNFYIEQAPFTAMRKINSFILCALIFFFVAACTSGATDTKTPASPRVMVLGIDGGTWDVAEPLIKAGELPNLAKLYANSVHGVLVSRPPALSPVVWTTIFTGYPYKVHGVVDWKHSQSKNRNVKTIWEIASGAHRRADVFNVPGSWPPTEVNGVLLSGFPISGENIGGNTGSVVKLKEFAKARGWSVNKNNADIIIAAAAKLKEGQWSPWLDAHLDNRPNMTGIIRVMKLSDGEAYVSPYYRTDTGVKLAYPPSARGDVEKKLGMGYIAEGPGWSRWAEPQTPVYLYDHLEQVFDIQAAAAGQYAGSDWDLFVYVMTFTDRISHPYWAYSHPGDYKGLDPAKAARFKSAVADSYRATDRHLGELLKKARESGHGEPYVILASDHGFHSNTSNDKAVGTHSFEGIYLVAGPGIHGSIKGKSSHIENIAPTALYLLGLPAAEEMDGRVIEELPGLLDRPVKMIKTYERVSRKGSTEPVDADTWKQLCGLGYVECE